MTELKGANQAVHTFIYLHRVVLIHIYYNADPNLLAAIVMHKLIIA